MSQPLNFMVEWIKNQEEKNPELLGAWRQGLANESNSRAPWRFVNTLGSTQHPQVLSHEERAAWEARNSPRKSTEAGLQTSLFAAPLPQDEAELNQFRQNMTKRTYAQKYEEGSGIHEGYNDPNNPAIADAIRQRSRENRKGPIGRALEGIKEGYLYGSRGGVGFQEHFLGPLHAVLPSNKTILDLVMPGEGSAPVTLKNFVGFDRGADAQELAKYMRKNEFGKSGWIGAHVGNALAQIGGLWPMRIPWRLDFNDLMSTYAPDVIAEKAGLSKSDTVEAAYAASPDPTTVKKKYIPGEKVKFGPKLVLSRSLALPIGVAAVGTANALSGNTDLTKLFNTDEGPRPKGYKAAQSDYDNPTKTSLYPFALGSAIAGSGPRPLDWARFHAERPEVSEEKYRDYMKYFYGDTDESEEPLDFSLFNGMIKGTASNLEGMPELRLLGSRVTPLGLIGGAAAGYGVAKGIQALLKPKVPTKTPLPDTPVGETAIHKMAKRRIG